MDRAHEAFECGGDAPAEAPRAASSTDTGDAPRSRLGVLGGSFNPPHRGHTALAVHAGRELGLERVLLMPARLSPGKPAEGDPGQAHRLEMCRLAVTGVEGLAACALEMEREGPSYTVDTLRALHVERPNIEITFILGADVARTLPSWRESDKLFALARLAVALRPGTGPEEVREAVGALAPGQGVQLTADVQPIGGPIGFLSMTPIDVSSSLVRDRVRRGLPVEEQVGTAVASYIAEHGLYRDAGAHGEAGGSGVVYGNATDVRAGDVRARGGAA